MSASPQRENGYTAIANEIMEALSKMRIAGEARQVLDFILRKTYGFNKKQDRISLSQFYLGTGLSKPHIQRAIHHLESLNLVIVAKNGNKNGNLYRFNKDFTTWKPLPKKETVANNGILPLPKKGHTKVDYTKVDIYSLRLIVDRYYELKEYSDKIWCKENYGRFTKVAKSLLRLTQGKTEPIMKALENAPSYFKSKNLSWSLDTINKCWNELIKEETTWL